jgi:hypothetical protein
MQKIYMQDNHAYDLTAYLDGRRIDDGQWLRVRFPDGTEKELQVRIVTRKCSVGGHNDPPGDIGRSHDAVYDTRLYGVRVEVPLNRCEAERIGKPDWSES